MSAFSQSLPDNGSDKIYDFSCYFCDENYQHTEATNYCTKCSKCYCDNCILKHNQIFQNHSVFGKTDTTSWPIRKSTIEQLRRCQYHQDETIKLYCEDHSDVFCHTCVDLHHRQCSRVTLIANAAEQITQPDLLQLTSSITKMRERVKKRETDIELNMQLLLKTNIKTKEEIYAFRKKINDALDELEKTSLREVEDLTNKLKESIQTDVANCKSMRKELNKVDEAIKDVSNIERDLVFIAQTKCSKIVKQCDEILYENSFNLERTPIFQFDCDIEDNLSKLKSLGIIAIYEHTISINQKSEHSLKIAKDTSSCAVRGIVCLPNSQIIILDSGNNRVKLLNQKFSVVSDCHLSSSSYGICQINSSNEVVVTVDDGDYHELQFITVTNGQLLKGKKIQLPHTCIGIANHQEDLYVTSSTALYHYTLKGKLVKKLYEDTTGGTTVYMCAVNNDGNKIYVTNFPQHRLLTLSRDGTVLNSLTDPALRPPVGVHVTGAGQVLVCGQSSKTIIQVDSKGRKKIATLASQIDGCSDPISINYNRHTRAVIVGCINNNQILALVVE